MEDTSYRGGSYSKGGILSYPRVGCNSNIHIV